MNIRIKHSRTEIGLVFQSWLWVLLFLLFRHISQHLLFLFFCLLYMYMYGYGIFRWSFFPVGFSVRRAASFSVYLPIPQDKKRQKCSYIGTQLEMWFWDAYSTDVNIYVYTYFVWASSRLWVHCVIPYLRPLATDVYVRVSKLRPAGQMQPTKPFYPKREDIFPIMIIMKNVITKNLLRW